MTFCKPEEETSADEGPQREHSTSGERGDRDLGLPPTMSPDLEQLLGMPAAGGSAGHRWSMWPKPFIENYKKMVGMADTTIGHPHGWEELTAIPGVEDIWKLVWKIQASFEVPSVRGRL